MVWKFSVSEATENFQGLPHPRALAFLGDAVFEIFLREMAVARGLSQSKDLHTFTTERARATAQVALLHELKPLLTEAELEIVRQGRNVAVSTARRSEQAAHRQATGFEALLGALYLTDQKRLEHLLAQARAYL
jgi:ribonuclease-3 family protein